MSLNDVLIVGALVASVIAGLLGFRRGDVLRATNAKTTAPFALVGPTLADSQLMEEQTKAMMALAEQLKRLADQGDERKASKTHRIEELMEKLAERLDTPDEAPPRRR